MLYFFLFAFMLYNAFMNITIFFKQILLIFIKGMAQNLANLGSAKQGRL